MFDAEGVGGEVPAADGGGVDNLGIHAALRRGVTKVCLLSTLQQMPSCCQWCYLRLPGSLQILTCYAGGLDPAVPLDPTSFWNVAGMFWAVPTSFKGPKMGGGVIPTAQWNTHIQVF